MAHIFQAQLTSLIAEGAFERFPELRVVLLESGFGWLPPLLWRLDKEWKGLRREIPWVKQRALGDDPRARARGRPADRRAARPATGLARLARAARRATSCSSSRATTRTPRTRPTRRRSAGSLPPELDRRIRFGNAAALYRL